MCAILALAAMALLSAPLSGLAPALSGKTPCQALPAESRGRGFNMKPALPQKRLLFQYAEQHHKVKRSSKMFDFEDSQARYRHL
jgi:hypothetical protein